MESTEVLIALSDPEKHILENLKRKLLYASSTIDCRCHLCGSLLLHFCKGICGHWFCKECIDRLRRAKTRLCPIDCTELRFVEEHGRNEAKIENEIYHLQVHCLNYKKGCKKMLILGKLLAHVRWKCSFMHNPSDWLELVKWDFLTFNSAKFTKNENQFKNAMDTSWQDNLMEETEFTLKMDRFEKKLQYAYANGILEVQGESFCINNTELSLTPKIYLYKDRLEFHLGFDQNYLPLIYYHKRTIALLDQSGSDSTKDVVRMEEPGFGKECAKNWMMPMTKSNSYSFQPISIRFFEDGSVYIKDGAIVFRITIQPLSILNQHFQSDSGTLQWMVRDYRQQKQSVLDGLNQWVTSDYFYSSPSGYRMRAALYFDRLSARDQKYASIHLDFYSGKYDSSLAELFPHRTIFKILNQDKLVYPLNDIQKVIDNTEGHLFGDRIDEFVSLSKLESPPFLMNGTISMRIIVQPL